MEGRTEAIDRIRTIVQERVGLLPRHIRDVDVQRALRAVADRTGITDPDEVCLLLEDGRHPAALDDVVSVLTVGETYFFRDPAQFRILAERILPPLVRGPVERPLQILSAGCSTGEEAWSLAMVVELVQRRNATHRPVRIIGVDIDHRALRVAADGVYGAWSFRGVDDSALERHFLRRGTQRQVRDRFRDQVRFHHANLADLASPIPRPDDGFDVVMCRNTLMYLDQDASRRVVARLRDLLRDDGWLIVAASETMLPVYDGFEPVTAPDATVLHKLPATPSSKEAPMPTSVAAPVPPTLADAPLTALRPTSAHAPALAIEPPTAPEWRHWYDQALCLRESGDLTGAADALRRAIYLDSSFAPAHLLLAGVLALRGNRRRARKELDIAQELLAAVSPDTQLLVDDREVTVERLLELVEAQREILAEVAS